MRKITFTLDNLTYSMVVKSSEDLLFVLPHKTPNDILDVSKGNNVIEPAEDITIHLFIKTDVSPMPKVNIIGQDDETIIITNGSFDLLPGSLMEITFTTVDGGATWLVNNCKAASAQMQDFE